MGNNLQKTFYWSILVISAACLLIGMFSSCGTIKKVKTDQYSRYDSTSNATAVTIRETNIRETGTVPVIINPGDAELEFSPEDTGTTSFENEFYNVQVTSGKKATESKPAQLGKVKVTGKDKAVNAPISRETTIKETTTAAQQSIVHKEEESHSKDKQTTGTPLYVWVIGLVLVGFIVYIIGKTFLK